MKKKEKKKNQLQITKYQIMKTYIKMCMLTKTYGKSFENRSYIVFAVKVKNK